MLRVLIASSSTLLAQLLSASLRNLSATIVVGVAENALSTLVAVRRMNLDVLLLDATLPNALSVCTQLRITHPHIRVIVLADAPQHQATWQVAGVEATLTKDASIPQLREALLGIMV